MGLLLTGLQQNLTIGFFAHAAEVSHKEIVELLIAKGADVNGKDKDDETPLDEAIISMLGLPGGHSETDDLLRKHGGKRSEELKAEGK